VFHKPSKINELLIHLFPEFISLFIKFRLTKSIYKNIFNPYTTIVAGYVFINSFTIKCKLGGLLQESTGLSIEFLSTIEVFNAKRKNRTWIKREERIEHG